MGAIQTEPPRQRPDAKGIDPPGPDPSSPPGLYSTHERLILGTLAILVALAAWEALTRTGLVHPILLSSPTRIVATGLAMLASGELSEHLWVSGTEFLVGFALAVVTGVPLGLSAGWYRRLNFVVDPFLAALYATPRIALLPLLVLWVGVGIWSKIAVVYLGAFFPICITVLTGVRTVDPVHLRVARTFRADDAHVFRTIILPSCVPFILAGLRLAVGRALVGVIVGEMYAASAGIGYLIMAAGATFQTEKVFVGIVTISIFGLLSNDLLSRVERQVEMWRPKVGSVS